MSPANDRRQEQVGRSLRRNQKPVTKSSGRMSGAIAMGQELGAIILVDDLAQAMQT
jgi:hypothetical protein